MTGARARDCNVAEAMPGGKATAPPARQRKIASARAPVGTATMRSTLKHAGSKRVATPKQTRTLKFARQKRDGADVQVSGEGGQGCSTDPAAMAAMAAAAAPSPCLVVVRSLQHVAALKRAATLYRLVGYCIIRSVDFAELSKMDDETRGIVAGYANPIFDFHVLPPGNVGTVGKLNSVSHGIGQRRQLVYKHRDHTKATKMPRAKKASVRKWGGSVTEQVLAYANEVHMTAGR